jgi:voltage-gated sodium channel
VKQPARSLVNSGIFEIFIILVIITNSLLIGVETYTTTPLIHSIQSSTLYIFTFEILVRWIAGDSVKSFFSYGWNVFDLSIVLVSFIPESMFPEAGMVTAVRVLRVFRVMRLFRVSQEIKLIVSVLIRSFSALTHNALFLFILMYLISIIGVTLFKLPDAANASPEVAAKLAEYAGLAPDAPTIAPYPYGKLGGTMFTLFRILTGEDWTDIRYNLILANEKGLIHSSETIITAYRILWFVLSAFLLLNLLVGHSEQLSGNYGRTETT